MKTTMLKMLAAGALGAAALFPVLGHAQTAGELTDAEVRKVDKDTKKITLKHGAIKNLDMPPMTMVFQVTDPAMLDKVKTGDKVRFAATGENGKYTITQIEMAK